MHNINKTDTYKFELYNYNNYLCNNKYNKKVIYKL